MKLAKIIRRKRAVSPVLAAILLIGLAVAAAAALFFVVLPLLATSAKVEFHETPVFTSSTATIKLKSTGTKDATITNITIQVKNGTSYDDNIFASFDFTDTTIATGQGETFSYTFDPPINETTTDITKWRVTVTYKAADDVSDTPTEYTLGSREFNP